MPQKPDAVILTGDLTDFGGAREYAHLAELLACLEMPFYLMPGNHDDRENLRAAFPAHGYLGSMGFIQYVITERRGSMRHRRPDWYQ
jgi:3',5'-cyclic AMP phosphodiesterase CpdA